MLVLFQAHGMADVHNMLAELPDRFMALSTHRWAHGESVWCQLLAAKHTTGQPAMDPGFRLIQAIHTT